MSRGDVFLNAIDLLQGGYCVEITGELGAGRSYFLQRVRAHFLTIGWHPIEISGVESFHPSSFAALHSSGVLRAREGRQISFADAYGALLSLIKAERTVILLDDAERMDEASWSVVSVLRARFGIPVVFTRLVSAAEPESARITGGSSAVFSLVLEAMSHSEMEAALESVMHSQLDTRMMSRIFAKSGGNIGLACAIVEAGRRSGRIEIVGGVARASRSLWSPMLSGLARRILQGLSPEDFAAMRTLAFLGPADVETAARLVSREQMLHLEARAFLVTHESGSGTTVMVRQAFLVEYFRHETNAGQRAEILAQLEVELAKTGRLATSKGPNERWDSPLFVRMVHEKTRLKTLQAREGWFKNPGFLSAAALLAALSEDSNRFSGEIASLISEVEGLDGPVHEQIEWEFVHALYLARSEGRVEDAVGRLEAVADAYPGYAPRFRASAFIWKTEFTPLPDTQPFTEIDLTTLDRVSRSLVVTARVWWLIVRGRAREAQVILTEQFSHDPDSAELNPHLDSLLVFTKLALDHYAEAIHIAETRLTAASTELDSQGIRMFASLRAITAILTSNFDDADRVLETAVSLGAPTGATTLINLANATSNGSSTLKRGHVLVMSQYYAGLESMGYNNVILPGLQKAAIFALIEAAEGNPVAARRIRIEDGDELWERGARFAAAYAYLEGMQLSPDEEAWRYISVRLRELDSPMIERWARFVDLLVQQDAAAIVTFIEHLPQGNGGVDPARFAQLALAVFGTVSATKDSKPALQALRALSADVQQTESASPVLLSARERQVAELIAAGLSNPRIAEALVLSIRTVESHVNRLMKKTGARNRSEIRGYLRDGDR